MESLQGKAIGQAFITLFKTKSTFAPVQREKRTSETVVVSHLT